MQIHLHVLLIGAVSISDCKQSSVIMTGEELIEKELLGFWNLSTLDNTSRKLDLFPFQVDRHLLCCVP
jgi:hypothetical protein